MSDPKEPSELQAAVEDTLGFNFRSLKTIKDLFVRPRIVFESYAARDRVTYTPAVKIWLGLIGLQVLVNALFGGWEGLIERTYSSDPETVAAYEEMTGGRVDEFIAHNAAFIGWTQVVAVGGFSALSVFVLGWFNKSVPWSGRFNIAMGVLTAGSVVGLFMMVVYAFDVPTWAYFVTTVPVILGYFVTFGRGAKGTLARTSWGAWVKAAIFSIILIALVVFAYMVIGVGAAIYAMAMLGPPPA